MTIRIENRPVEVKVCDFCGAETEHLERCVLCGRDACYTGGLQEHLAYHVEVYRYADIDMELHRKTRGYVCRECADGPSGKALRDFILKAK